MLNMTKEQKHVNTMNMSTYMQSRRSAYRIGQNANASIAANAISPSLKHPFPCNWLTLDAYICWYQHAEITDSLAPSLGEVNKGNSVAIV